MSTLRVDLLLLFSHVVVRLVEVDELVEIAIVITDFELNVLDPGFQIVIKPDDSALAHMNDFVTKMHESSGLLDEIPGAYKDIDQVMADQQDLVEVVAELRQVLCVKG